MFLLSEVLDFTLSPVTGFLLEKTFIGRLFVNLLIGKKVQLSGLEINFFVREPAGD